MTAADAVEFMLAGCSAVQVGTATFIHPGAMIRIIEELDTYCAEHAVARVADLIGEFVAPEMLGA
jgi:dihydroorotate dehydrogenase (NAD+) catalytic subunit